MTLTTAGALSHGVAAIAFLALFLALILRWRTRVHALGLALACALTALWAACAALAPELADVAEVLRDAAWSGLLLILLAPARPKTIGAAIAVLCTASLALPLAMVAIAARLMLAVLGMLLVEQVYRNTAPRERWGIKFACLGIGALFAYDFFLYSDAALFRRVNDEIWAARGLADALAVPLLAVAVARNPRWASAMAVSRTLMFHSAALLGSAIYLLAMASSGYYLRLVGGAWGRIMQLTFLSGAVILLAGALFSGSVRARLKVSINKHFYRDRFDYREEWLRFTRALSADGPALEERSIEAVARLVESPAGALWIERDAGLLTPVARWNMALPDSVPMSDPLCQFLATRLWVLDVEECRAHPQRYAGLAIPAWLAALPRIWLVVPLMLHGRLFGMVALAGSRSPLRLNWEVSDLLKIAGSQVASYLAHRESAGSLTVARQFESFNRMSTFIVHDLKNLVFQFSLLLSNAEKHRDNPAFQADMLDTLDHSVAKMKALLQKLSRGHSEQAALPLPIDALLRRAVAATSQAEPRPELELEADGLCVLAHADRLERVIGHLLQNAIEASRRDGRVRVRLSRRPAGAVIEVSDDGAGMDERFLRERLFRPFESTKPAGMGIGVFESREYIRELGGQLEVSSQPAVGTTFRVLLPLCANQENTDEQEEAAGDRG